ncbi:Coenzyme F420 hydrogenase/dehydrogenase, beta subunit C-terminal domain [Desulfuromonas versatilis]|uniref:Coenzyme F420 hydrogenase/dehydrogenase, beta subunit C-terminal domain n=1 Tax=Desulfuromonas versatilis TaxID=2802975 RepID=UPI001C8519F0|nr:Coenzyme F420 hydrogenase/dehydrogenase, beta subunit C-terminal domain [Desulfuromonas versatilis]
MGLKLGVGGVLPSGMKMDKSRQVVADIVERGLCCGCGICAGVCPNRNLEMALCGNGDIAPILVGECPSGCQLCMQVCPFGPQSKSEDRLAKTRFGCSEEAKFEKTVGLYLESFVGYSLVSDHRARGASGGMATWLLESLVRRGLVDAVVCVGEGKGNDGLFEYKAVADIEALRGAAGSRYYPVSVAEAVALMNEKFKEARYAVVGLPCVLKGLHLAMEALPRLRRRIVYTLGLTCGHMPNRLYTEYLASISGIPPGHLASAKYRLKENTGRAGNFKFQAVAKNGCVGVAIPFSKISNIWSDGYFQVNACNYCDDVFAEVADATFMDAWLPEYSHDPQGHSLIVVRHSALIPIFDEGVRAGGCHLKSLPVSKIVESQSGVIENKRTLLGARLHAASKRGCHVPVKRSVPDAYTYRRFRRKVETQFAIQEASKGLWPILGPRYLFAYRLYLWTLSLPLKLGRTSDRALRVLKSPSLLLRFIRRV